MRVIQALSLLGSMVGALSCTALESREEFVDNPGLPYFLPKTYLVVQVDVSDAPPAPASARQPTGRAAADATEGDGAAQPGKPDNPKKEASPAPPPKPMLSFTFGKHQVTLTADPTRGPDTSKLYFLSPTSNYFADDEFTLKTDSRGLLTSVDSIVEDRAGQVLVELAGAAAAGARLAFGGPTMPLTPMAIPQLRAAAAGEKKTLAAVITAALEASRGRRQFVVEGLTQCDCGRESVGFDPRPISVNKPFEANSAWIAVSFRRLGDATYSSPGEHESWWKVRKQEGVHTRAVEPYAISVALEVDVPEGLDGVASGAAKYTLVELQLLALVPDCAPEFVIPVERIAFDRVERGYAFEDGMLTQVKAKTPSPIFNVARIPVQILERATQVLGNLVPFRLGTSSVAQAKELADLQAKLLEIEKSRAEAAKAQGQ